MPLSLANKLTQFCWRQSESSRRSSGIGSGSGSTPADGVVVVAVAVVVDEAAAGAPSTHNGGSTDCAAVVALRRWPPTGWPPNQQRSGCAPIHLMTGRLLPLQATGREMRAELSVAHYSVSSQLTMAGGVAHLLAGLALDQAAARRLRSTYGVACRHWLAASVHPSNHLSSSPLSQSILPSPLALLA